MSQRRKSVSSRKDRPIHSKDKALLCARCALDKKAIDIRILHIGSLSSISEYFVICSGRSVRQVRAIAEHIQIKLKDTHRVHPFGVEGEQEGTWILLDYVDVVVHVFYEQTRTLYCLEKLWAEAPLIEPSFLKDQERALSEPLSDETDAWDE